MNDPIPEPPERGPATWFQIEVPNEPEVAAFVIIGSAFASLTPAAQRRVARWALDRATEPDE